MKHKITLLLSACLLSICSHAAAEWTPRCNDLIINLQTKPGHHCVLQTNTSFIRAEYTKPSYKNITNLTPQPTSILLSPRWIDGLMETIYLPIRSHLDYICDNRAESVTTLLISKDLKVGFFKPKVGAIHVSASPANGAVFTTSNGHCGRKKYRRPGVVNVTIG